jgi:hypothetical protein
MFASVLAYKYSPFIFRAIFIKSSAILFVTGVLREIRFEGKAINLDILLWWED